METTLQLSSHAAIRAQQRGISHQVIEHLLNLGAKVHCGGGRIRYFFNRRASQRLQSALPPKDYAKVERKLDAFAVVSQDGEIVTVGHQLKRIRR